MSRSIGRRKFTREFKEGLVRRIEQGTPVMEIARTYDIDPAMLREWRDALRVAGPEAFSAKRRRFTKKFKEAAVRRVEDGTPVKEVARACRVHPSKLRRWREAWRHLGAEAFYDKEPKKSAMIFRLGEDEHSRLKAIAKAAGAQSVSDFARGRLLDDSGTSTRPRSNRLRSVPQKSSDQPKTTVVMFRLTKGEHDRVKAIARAAGARSLADFARTRLFDQASPFSVEAANY